jgi:hypothetical protein
MTTTPERNVDAEKNANSPTNSPLASKESSEVGSVEGIDVLGLATEEHPAHPRNWPVLKRWGVLCVLCTFQAFMFDSIKTNLIKFNDVHGLSFH